MAAVAGRVTSQARKMFDATLKSSPLQVCSPTVDPATAEERTWVGETGAPTRLPTRMIRAAESWEEKPWTGVIPTWLIFSPTVRMIRQPPIVVPSPMAAAAVTTTQKGTPADLEWPNSAMRTSVIMPIVFCPSLEPCEKETAAPEKIVIHLRSLGWTTGFLPAALGPASGSVARVTTQARRTPEGEYDLGQGAPLDAGDPVSRQSCSHQASDEGMGTRYGEPVEPGPKVPHEPGDQGCEYELHGDHIGGNDLCYDHRHGCADDYGAEEVEQAAHGDGVSALHRIGVDDRGHRVRSVVEPVREIEGVRQGYGDQG